MLWRRFESTNGACACARVRVSATTGLRLDVENQLTLTCLPHKHFLWRAGRPLPHGVVHTQTDLVALVLAQICKVKKQSTALTPSNQGDTQQDSKATAQDRDKPKERDAEVSGGAQGQRAAR